MDYYSGYAHLACQRKNGVLTITLDRPDKLNAINAALHEELSRIFVDVDRDEETRVVVLTGRGEAFSAGGDLAYMEELRSRPDLAARSIREAKRIVFGMLDCTRPVICRMNGDAIGLGATLALFCDIVIGVRGARIADPHVRVGMVAGDGGAVIWPQLIGYARAKQYLLSGDAILAEDAAAIGLINFAVEKDALDETVARWATKLGECAGTAISWTKAAVNIGLKQMASAALDASMAYEALCWGSSDFREGMTALRDRRKPRFGGGEPS